MRVAIIGAGNMGQNHLRAYSLMRDVELVGLIEPDVGRAAEVAGRYSCRVFSTPEELIGSVDAVTIASPSVTHAEIGALLLARGVHCLIEKPLATTEQDCEMLIAAAKAGGSILMVGHIERYNPVVEQLSAFLSGGHKIYALDARRMSAGSKRITDVDVVMDLMIHDLDVACSLLGEPGSIQAQGIRGEFGYDYVNALVRFGETVASFTASRITQNKVRELQITADLGYIQADYMRQEMYIYRQSRVAPLPQGPGGFALDLSMDRVMIRNAEPLMREVSHFIECVKRSTLPTSDGAAALQAMRLGWAIQDQLAEIERARA